MRNMKGFLSALVLIVLALAPFSCKPETETIETDEGRVEIRHEGDKADITIETKEGETYTMSVNKGTLPDGWPSELPVIPGGEIAFAQSATKEGVQQVHIQTDRSVQDAFSFYRGKLQSGGWKIGNTMTMPMMNIVTAEKDGQKVMLQVAQAEEKTFIQIAIEQ